MLTERNSHFQRSWSSRPFPSATNTWDSWFELPSRGICCWGMEASGIAEECEPRGIEIIWAIPHSHTSIFVMLPPEIWKAQEDSARRGGGGSKGEWNLNVSFLFTYRLSHCLPWSFSLPLPVATAVGVGEEEHFFLRDAMLCTQGLETCPKARLPSSPKVRALLAS